jgi:hypothetical protein
MAFDCQPSKHPSAEDLEEDEEEENKGVCLCQAARPVPLWRAALACGALRAITLCCPCRNAAWAGLNPRALIRRAHAHAPQPNQVATATRRRTAAT